MPDDVPCQMARRNTRADEPSPEPVRPSKAFGRDGVALTCRPDITVGHKMHDRVSDHVSERYLDARAYAGMKRAWLPFVRRALFTTGSFALPPLLLARRVLASHRHRAALVQSLPLFVCAWAAGEALGYAADLGEALARVR